MSDDTVVRWKRYEIPGGRKAYQRKMPKAERKRLHDENARRANERRERAKYLQSIEFIRDHFQVDTTVHAICRGYERGRITPAMIEADIKANIENSYKGYGENKGNWYTEGTLANYIHTNKGVVLTVWKKEWDRPPHFYMKRKRIPVSQLIFSSGTYGLPI